MPGTPNLLNNNDPKGGPLDLREKSAPAAETAVPAAANDRRPKYHSLWPVFLIFVLLAAAAVFYFTGGADYFDQSRTAKPEKEAKGNNGTITPVDPALDQGGKLFSFNLTKPVFAPPVAAAAAATPAFKGEKPSVSELDNLEAFVKAGLVLTDDQRAALGDMGFFLAVNDLIKDQTGGNDDFADTYASFSGPSNMYYREPQNSLFISSDVALHLYHILIDRSFQKIEEVKFQPMLKSMTKALFEDSLNRHSEASDPTLKASYERLAAYYLIPLVILDAGSKTEAKLDPSQFGNFAEYLAAVDEQEVKKSAAKLDFSLNEKTYNGREISEGVFAIAKAEIDLIAKATGLDDSPLFTPYRPYFKNDYSQFKPRSHYTKNDVLKSYFIAMMWYGRMGFSLDSPELTRDAIAITGQINTLSAGEEKLADMYGVLSAAIEFFVGEVDDLTPYEYSDLINEQYGDNLTGAELADAEMLDNFIKAAIDTLPQPRIVSEAVELYDDGGERDALLKKLMQFRFMGQRFTPDAYVLNQLTQGVGAPDPETGQNLPSMTTALMPIAVLAPQNKVVAGYVNEWVIAQAPQSDKIIAKKLAGLSAEFAGYDSAVWTQNIYWNWLNSYRSLLAGYGGGYPYFMVTENWQRKNLGTVLGSYTELKHDTLLYAKQSYAELGAGGPEDMKLPPVPKGYVEADPVFWSRIVALAKMTAEGLKARELMPEHFGERYDSFIENSEFFLALAKKELQNEIISDDEFEELRTSGQVFKRLTDPLPGEELSDKERRAGIIADIHTDAVDGLILYEATGKPYIIYVAVKDQNGARLTRGAVYNHYELTGPLTERYADEDWQAKVYAGQGEIPAADKWSRELVK